jgi:hypothetical protein
MGFSWKECDMRVKLTMRAFNTDLKSEEKLILISLYYAFMMGSAYRRKYCFLLWWTGYENDFEKGVN